MSPEALQHKAERGEFTGGVAPFGYKLGPDGAMLVKVEAEQAVIADARALRTAGMSLRKVAEALDARGLRARTGRRFAAEQVKRMIAA